MRGFQNWKTAYKIIFLVLLMMTFMFSLSGIGYFYYAKARSAMNEIYNSSTISLKLITDTNERTKASEFSLLEALLAPNEANKQQQLVIQANVLIALGEEALEKYSTLALDPYESQRIIRLKEILNDLKAQRQNALTLLENGEHLEAYRYYTTHTGNELEELNTLFIELSDFNIQKAGATIARDNLNFERAERLLFTLPLLFGLIALTFGFYVSRLISKPLQTMLRTVDQLKDGNLDIQPLHISSHDEVGKLALGINEMLMNLRHLVQAVVLSTNEVTNSAHQLRSITAQSTSASEHISIAMNEVASGTERQASAINDTSFAIKNISSNIYEIANYSKSVTQRVSQAEETARSGQQTISHAIAQMTEIGQGTEQVQNAFVKLSFSSNQISDITQVISSIAEKTNLLALNAAIEAARAGEHGRGFSVVAQEVKKLAEQAEVATKEIISLIRQNQSNLDYAIQAMERESTLVHTGIEVVNHAGKGFEQIMVHIKEIVIEIQTTSSSIQAIAKITDNLVANVNITNQVGKETSAQAQIISASLEEQNALLEDINGASQSLALLAQSLLNEISRFKLNSLV